MSWVWLRVLLNIVVCWGLYLAAFVSQASSPDYRGLLHFVTPLTIIMISAGCLFTALVRTWDRWIPVPFILLAAWDYRELFVRAGW